MNSRLLALTSLVLSLTFNAAAATREAATREAATQLRYHRPASAWTEALPVGNGRMGAMIYGGVTADEIQLNEGTFWGGGPYRNDNSTARDSLERVRQLIFSDRRMDAQKLINKTFLTRAHGMPFHTLGSLLIERPQADTSTVSGYVRTLDLQDAVATTVWSEGGTAYRTEVIASHPTGAVIVHLTASRKGALTFTLRMRSPLPTANPKRSHSAWVVAVTEGDATHKRIVQPIQISLK